jgi:hypothetical protein
MSIEPTVTYPVTIPLSLFREAEQSAKEDRATLEELIIACLRADAERFRDIQQFPFPKRLRLPAKSLN